MKKNYNIPATEVVALESGMIMQAVTTSPNPLDPNITPTPVPDPNNPQG